MNRALSRAGATFSVAALLMFSAGCGEHRSLLSPADGPPVLRLEAARTGVGGTETANFQIRWSTVSGHADHYLYAVNPASVGRLDPSWVTTGSTSYRLAVPRARTDMTLSREGRAAKAVTFAAVAVDARGRRSDVQYLSFVGDNIAPTVQILSPRPSDLGRSYVAPGVEVRWQGVDPDGPGQLPMQYKFTVLGPGSPFSVETAIADPDSVRRYYAPRGYAGWDSTRSTSVNLNQLVPAGLYVFVVVAEDVLGATTQVFSFNTNMLLMACVPATAGGPVLTLYDTYFNYRYPAPTYSTDPRYQVPLTVFERSPVTVNWFGTAQPSASIAGYRWALDIASVADNTPRLRPNDFSHWSTSNPGTVSATVGPFAAGETHVLYVEGTDTNGLKSLGMVRIQTVETTHRSGDLLIVNDTRFVSDQRLAGATCVMPPIGRWPTAAELDTFLFARGGFPWQCYPAGTYSSPGLFKGYSFDTIGTRTQPGGIVPLGVLSRYRHVIWMTDRLGALKIGGAAGYGTGDQQITALRLMSSYGQQNLLATYVASGGKVWLLGGGSAYANLIFSNNLSNDRSGTTFSSALGELGPGRMMYDQVHWRSEIRSTGGYTVSISRSLGRLEAPIDPHDRVDGGERSALLYKTLPRALSPKSLAAGDTFPPNRSPTPGNFYTTIFFVEYLSLPNTVVEDRNPGPRTRAISTLDTLYEVSGTEIVPQANNPVMTYYHGEDNAPLVFSGFDIWDFQRVQCRALVDFVLQRLWGLSPSVVGDSDGPGGGPDERPTRR